MYYHLRTQWCIQNALIVVINFGISPGHRARYKYLGSRHTYMYALVHGTYYLIWICLWIPHLSIYASFECWFQPWCHSLPWEIDGMYALFRHPLNSSYRPNPVSPAPFDTLHPIHLSRLLDKQIPQHISHTWSRCSHEAESSAKGAQVATWPR